MKSIDQLRTWLVAFSIVCGVFAVNGDLASGQDGIPSNRRSALPLQVEPRPLNAHDQNQESPSKDSEKKEIKSSRESNAEQEKKSKGENVVTELHRLHLLIQPIADEPLKRLSFPPVKDPKLARPESRAEKLLGLDESVGLPSQPISADPWIERSTGWLAPVAFHQPLYFEDVSLERFGESTPFLQPEISLVRFTKDVLIFPIQLLAEKPGQPQYVPSHLRPTWPGCMNR